ncbi:1,3-propanediol dehydrogenase (plasmid) [Variovorax sp. SRS16]|uniref:iron-containing alcohol dehydrogenase n=1 Tax=Variovorax sp. SRS16 TaxID=282217 RepID=UPI0013198FC5|nr:iron-containing alcohol dehydrogenase [Variovorax sp. SRS16]VTU45395.1 1,3-propanediol dehydrogenase [Variovorax sp. SRS16]
MALIQYITQINVEAGALKLLAAECQRVGIKRPMIVSDRGVVAAGIVDKVLKMLQGVDATVFAETPSNPTEAAIRLATSQCKASGCDGLIAVGGGSSIDCAKGIAIAATHEGPLKSFATIEGGTGLITARVLPIIAIPTTSGTGSEVARGAIIIVDDKRKLGFHSWDLVPKSAICDPELTLGLPPLLTAATAMDAIAHCIETYLAPSFNPPADGIALDGLGRAWGNIERATKNGADIDARLNLMCASFQGALAFQKGLGCVHSLSHSLGGLLPGLHHGTLNAVFLPTVLRFNSQAPSVQKDRRMEELARVMGVNSPDAVPGAIRDMSARLGLPVDLRSMGVERKHFSAIVSGAMADHCHLTNPRRATADDYMGMLEETL